MFSQVNGAQAFAREEKVFFYNILWRVSAFKEWLIFHLFTYWYREEDEIQVQKAIDEVWLDEKTNVDCLEYNNLINCIIIVFYNIPFCF